MPGQHQIIQDICHSLNTGSGLTLCLPIPSVGSVPSLDQFDTEEVSSVLKKYLRELPESIITDGSPDNKLQKEVNALVAGVPQFAMSNL